MKEIEWKYIARLSGMPDVERLDKFMSVKQGYIIAGENIEWRVRRTTYHRSTRGTVWHTAVKIGNGFVRREYEVQIPAWLGAVLSFFVPQFIEKIRIAQNGWDTDLFQGSLERLILAEAEIPNIHTPMPETPEWLDLVEDVTGNPNFANKNLSRLAAEDAHQIAWSTIYG